MNLEEKQEKYSLIPLLIEYSKLFGKAFPMENVKHLSNEELISRISNCIKEKNLYNPQIFKLDKMQKMSENDMKKIINLVMKSMDSINYDYKSNINEMLYNINMRNHGKKYDFSEHLEALIITLLSNHRWGDSNIKDNYNKIKEIFHYYNKDILKNLEPSNIIIELKKIHCTNPMIKEQMNSLKYNINILESIEKEYESLDNFVLSKKPNDIANCFNEGKYSLKQVGRAFSFDYLKRVGINTCKSSIQLQRLFGSTRLNIVDNELATNGQVISIIKKLSNFSKLSEVEVESLLQQFCLAKCSNICSENPNCDKCKLRSICSYDK